MLMPSALLIPAICVRMLPMYLVIAMLAEKFCVCQWLSIGPRNPNVWILLPLGGLRILYTTIFQY